MHSIECGEEYTYSTEINPEIINSLFDYNQQNLHLNLLRGKCIGANDFYEEQARLDGFLTLEFTPEDRDAFFANAESRGVKAFNMEVTAFYAFCRRVGFSACAVNAIIVDRRKSDNVTIPLAEQFEIVHKAFYLVSSYIVNKFKPLLNQGV